MSHIRHEELNKQIAEASKLVIIGRIYKHYKYPDRQYLIKEICIQEATEKLCVVYHDSSVKDAPSFVRDLDSWLETVEWEGRKVPRFVIVDTV